MLTIDAKLIERRIEAKIEKATRRLEVAKTRWLIAKRDQLFDLNTPNIEQPEKDVGSRR